MTTKGKKCEWKFICVGEYFLISIHNNIYTFLIFLDEAKKRKLSSTAHP